MDILEKKYRETPKNPIAFKYYINDLIKTNHILEARFFCNLFLNQNENIIEANKIGYRLAIKCLDYNVKKFDEQLWKLNASKEEIYTLQLEYYLTFRNDDFIINCTDNLLDIETKTIQSIEAIVESIRYTKNYYLASKFIKYHYQRIKSSEYLDKLLKKILILKLKNIISNYIKLKNE